MTDTRLQLDGLHALIVEILVAHDTLRDPLISYTK